MAETMQDPDISDRLGRLLDPLPADEITPDRLERPLSEAQAELPWPSLHTALLERIERLDTARDRMALVLHASDPDIAAQAAGKRSLEGVFEVLVAAADAAGLDTYLSRCETLLEQDPPLRHDLPAVARLIEIADQIEAELDSTAEALIAMAQQIEDLHELDDTDPAETQ